MLAAAYLTVASLIASTAAHGLINSPTPRGYGTAARAACGEGAYNSLTSDLTGPIESAARAVDSGFNAAACNLYFCRGTQFSDNTDKVSVFQLGQQVHMTATIRVRHTGVANVSVVDVKSQSLIGKALIDWPDYTDTSIPAASAPKNETDFFVTIPTDLGTKCQTAGNCALQWWWLGNNAQTYESCVDFITSA